ncbi:hypothetical protein Cni_G06639 [Canna indica]|uniref:Uncharacterized protein n=1 Tax=Canna indica TaxID=4628 RepID=A0AAQ3K0L8_9LILI|nr:hypothetical protein Cni_G06639 [Canna indica]
MRAWGLRWPLSSAASPSTSPCSPPSPPSRPASSTATECVEDVVQQRSLEAVHGGVHPKHCWRGREHVTEKKEALGEVLNGDRLVGAPYELNCWR